MIDPIQKSVTVPLTPTEAFALFTSKMDLWWPKAGYSVGGAASKLHFPSHKNGEITETDAGGTTHVWGRVIACEPGAYVAFSWHPDRPESEATVVEMRSIATDTGTSCDLTHGGFDILGPTADAISTSYLHGWDIVLGCYRGAVKRRVFA
ncbi:hypothetical protein [Yoonia sediminilitoris]|uniref:Activator of Hsp90 ATPase-like protein n=1 Tax=Yoonia sediminilitoris TaxID=1286148 RepID=A0A2T6KQP7_9RHOB|nr:hypothetical protein [Yoonia sediminilitoris]PUB18872.1 hypothetical protein C8N45_101463 [Yoonia sediminilitoris]RCW99040.1 hypothetical protein DFP92_101463 [Yoonia sediminilitoris]